MFLPRSFIIRAMVPVLAGPLLVTASVVSTEPAGTGPATSAAVLARPADPVVLDGSRVPRLIGVDPDKVVAYQYLDGWQQIPVQVDERDYVSYTQIKGGQVLPPVDDPLVYTDRATFTGADHDLMVDADDEIVFTARDAAVRAPAGTVAPPGTVRASTTELEIADPLAPPARGYVYLFAWGAGAPPATRRYQEYTFQLVDDAGDPLVYLDDYNLVHGPNPETSTVSTPSYQLGFSDRWIRDSLQLGAVPGEDLLDRDKILFEPGFCGRSEDTASGVFPKGTGPQASRGAFIANIDGPVRGIRSYLGANSGLITQRDHFFYDRREDVVTTLRVHRIPGVMSFFEFSSFATGMTYRAKPIGGPPGDPVTINGAPDQPSPPAPPELGPELEWELVTGGPGSIIRAPKLVTEQLAGPDPDPLGFVAASYYQDDNRARQCTGDDGDAAYGASGVRVVPEPGDDLVPCTDPLRYGDPMKNCPSLWSFVLTLHVGYLRPGVVATPATAQSFTSRAETPLDVTVR